MSQTSRQTTDYTSSSEALSDGPISPKRSPLQRLLLWIVRVIPTVAVLAALGGVGYWGHHSGWKIPRFSELTSTGEVEVVQWCEEHGVAEADCVSCNAKLMPKGQLHGWCKEHGVHECVLHHPDVAQLSDKPELSPADFDRATRAIALRPRTKNDPVCQMHLRRIQFSSKAAADKAGIDIDLVGRGSIVESVSATGEIIYDPTRVARLASRVGGTVWLAEKNVGDLVRKGELLALIDAADVGKAKSELLDALSEVELHKKTVERIAPLYRKQIVTAARMQEAATALQQADIRIRRAEQALSNLGLRVSANELARLSDAKRADYVRLLGLSTDIRSRLAGSTISNNLIPVVASFSGVVTHREAVVGEVMTSSDLLYQIVDTTSMWLMLNVPLEQVKLVSVGQTVVFRTDGDDESHTGRLTWVSTEVDAETRTVKVRGELPNENGQLRDESFGSGAIVLREENDAIIVANSALHWEGCCHVVFVRDKGFMQEDSYKVFHTRSVRPGLVMGDQTEMIAGLLPGEVVVTKGSGVLRAELLKGNLGAG